MQEFTAIGFLGHDPEMQYTAKGVAVTHFNVGCRSGRDETLWVRVTAWDKRAENCREYLKKGSQVYVKGPLEFDPETGSPKTFTTKDGQTKCKFEMTAYTVEFLDRRGEREEEPRQKSSGGVPWK